MPHIYERLYIVVAGLTALIVVLIKNKISGEDYFESFEMVYYMVLMILIVIISPIFDARDKNELRKYLKLHWKAELLRLIFLIGMIVLAVSGK